MKILALDKPNPNATMEQILPLLKEETAHLWRVYNDNVVREMYYRTDRMGVALILECASVEEAQRVLADFPLAKAGLADFELIPLGPFVGLRTLFAAE